MIIRKLSSQCGNNSQISKEEPMDFIPYAWTIYKNSSTYRFSVIFLVTLSISARTRSNTVSHCCKRSIFACSRIIGSYSSFHILRLLFWLKYSNIKGHSLGRGYEGTDKIIITQNNESWKTQNTYRDGFL